MQACLVLLISVKFNDTCNKMQIIHTNFVFNFIKLWCVCVFDSLSTCFYGDVSSGRRKGKIDLCFVTEFNQSSEHLNH